MFDFFKKAVDKQMFVFYTKNTKENSYSEQIFEDVWRGREWTDRKSDIEKSKEE